jgi:hypothetical protein
VVEGARSTRCRSRIDFIYLSDEDYQAATKKQPASTNQQQQ